MTKSFDVEKYPIKCAKDLDRFIGGPASALVKFLEGSYLGLFASGIIRPKGWPKQILRVSKDAYKNVSYRMNLTGKRWSNFYAYSYYLDKDSPYESGFLFQKSKVDLDYIFMPIARCDIYKDKRIKEFDFHWCRVAICGRISEARKFKRPL